MPCHLRLVIVINVKDRVGDTSILSLGSIEIIRHKFAALILQGYILKLGITVDGSVDIWLCLLAEVDLLNERKVLSTLGRHFCTIYLLGQTKLTSLGVAATLKVEYTILIPTMFVVSNECSVRISRECLSRRGIIHQQV